MDYEGLLDKSYDKKFKKEFFTWLPWVGVNYKNASKKLLIVGESNYGEGIEGDLCFTRNVIKDFQIDFQSNKTFDNFDKLLDLNTNEKIKTFWANTAFYDYVQREMKLTKDRPNNEDFIKGADTFNEIMNILQPDYVLFIGVTALDKLTKMNTPEINKILVKDKIGNCRPREAFYGERRCKLLAIHHTGRYFSNKNEWESLIVNEFKGIKKICK